MALKIFRPQPGNDSKKDLSLPRISCIQQYFGPPGIVSGLHYLYAVRRITFNAIGCLTLYFYLFRIRYNENLHALADSDASGPRIILLGIIFIIS